MCKLIIIFVTVFHRILDFKTGLDFYPGPFFLPFIEMFQYQCGFCRTYQALQSDFR